MIEHIREIWCGGNAELFDYVMGWLARLFQHPDERGHTVLLLQSGQGTGKNIIIDELVRAFGDHATVCVKPDDLVGKFNAHLATSVLVFANEAIWGGDKKLEGSLKSLVTDEEMFVEQKRIPKYRVLNRTHLIMASNNDWAAPIDFDDRRFVVLGSAKRGRAIAPISRLWPKSSKTVVQRRWSITFCTSISPISTRANCPQPGRRRRSS
jgi:hypothetical protein